MRLLSIAFFIISSLFSFGLLAQEESYDEGEYSEEPTTISASASEKLAKVAARLQLTDAQLPQVEAILLEFAAMPTPTTPEEKKTRRRALRARVTKLLTPEQRALIRQGRNKTPTNTGKSATGKRSLLDILIDDVAKPLLDQRGKGKNGPN